MKSFTSLALLLCLVSSTLADEPPRPRIIVTTDGETDDQCSMVRFLMYANMWNIEGIIHSSSKFHWKGNGKDIPRHKWTNESWLDRQINLYEKVYPNLSKHAPGFPTAEDLRKLVYTGNVENVGEMEKITPGSQRIVEVLLDDEPGPVYLQAWGGTNTIARALKTVQQQHPDQITRVSKKAIIYIILDQDKTFNQYIKPNWPEIQVLYSRRQFGSIAYAWHRFMQPQVKQYFVSEWMRANILKDHGPLCAAYKSRGGNFISEGDSPAYMHQIDVGLRSLEHPTFGGWGGRFARLNEKSNVWPGAKDGDDLNEPILRWAIAFQNDWAARADWCVEPYERANHPPVAKVQGNLDIAASLGQKINLDATGSTDPDGNELTFKWWQYSDADTYPDQVTIADTTDAEASFQVPSDIEPGQTIHIILEVTDKATLPLTRYARIIVTAQESKRHAND
ncbi:MAG: hypothetical protein COA78_27810 [Blastopirellula sp.]|nr:MAG: hypothetical protein COA78_27810 [Blastopirellula sp.]